jgi:transcriptional regulator with XRE-family HTH domain
VNTTQRIFELLRVQNKKQSDLAGYIRISRSAVSDWKSKGTTPTAEYLVKISEFFNVSLDFLLTGEDKNSADKRNSVIITEDEQEVLDLYKKLGKPDKTIIKGEMYKIHKEYQNSRNFKNTDNEISSEIASIIDNIDSEGLQLINHDKVKNHTD